VGSGYLSNPYEAIFQIKVTPLSSQANQSIELTNETIFTAIDSFTLKEIKKTYLPLKSDSLTAVWKEFLLLKASLKKTFVKLLHFLIFICKGRVHSFPLQLKFFKITLLLLSKICQL